METPKYPKIKVKLTGKDGNAFFILARVKYAMEKHKVPQDEIKKFMDEAMAGNYDNLSETCMKWVTIS